MNLLWFLAICFVGGGAIALGMLALDDRLQPAYGSWLDNLITAVFKVALSIAMTAGGFALAIAFLAFISSVSTRHYPHDIDAPEWTPWYEDVR